MQHSKGPGGRCQPFRVRWLLLLVTAVHDVSGWPCHRSDMQGCCEDSGPPYWCVESCTGCWHSTSSWLLDRSECLPDLQACRAAHLQLCLPLQRPPQRPALFARLQPSTSLQQGRALRARSCHPAASLQGQRTPQAQRQGTLMPRPPTSSTPPPPGQGRALCSSSRGSRTAECRSPRSQLRQCLTQQQRRQT